MKKIALFLAMAVAALACTPEENTVTPELKVLTEASELVAPQAESQVYIDFETNVDWAATIEATDWCTLSPNPATGAAGTHKLTVTCLANETNDNRTVKVVITAQGESQEVVITQLQKDALTVGEKTFSVPAEGGNVEFTVSHNVKFTATSDAEWLTKAETKAMESTKVTFVAAANTGAERTVSIVVTDGTLSETLTVTQAAWVPHFEVSPAVDQWLAVEGGSVSIEVDANVEYEVAVDDCDWLTMTQDGDTYTFTAAANESFDYRAVAVYVTPKDEAFVDSAVAFYVFQNGRVSKLWAKHPAEDFAGYDAAQKVRLAKYGDNILVANTTKVFVLDVATGEVVNTIAMPEGVTAHNVLVDDAGNFMIAADAPYEATTTLYLVPDPTNPVPEELLSFNTLNYYCVEVGNFRVKGNVKDDAVVTLTVADGGLGAVIFWEIVDGVFTEVTTEWGSRNWDYVVGPYSGWASATTCAAPAGTALADGLFFVAYGGDYNLKYKAPGAEWATTYVTGSTWMENYNCIATAEWKGDKYAAYVMGCHFDYDSADAVLVNVNDPAAAQHVYTHYGDGDVAWDWEAGVNPSWTGLGTYSDILLVPTADALLMIYVDSNYGAMACVSIK